MSGRSPSREVYSGLNVRKLPKKRRWRRRLLLLAALILLASLALSAYLRRLSSGTALSDARDMVTLAIGDCVERILAEDEWAEAEFVVFHTDAEGRFTAVTTDTRQVNRFTARVLREITEAAERGGLDVKIRLGDLLGSNLLLGRGPEIPVRVGMMTSPDLRLVHDFSSTGINQTRHALSLAAGMDVDLFIPWGSMSTHVETEVLIAETLIVGQVPDTYLNTEEHHG